jgi:uncharacterized phage protein gp47/JayE
MPNPVQFTPLRAPRIFGDRDLRQYMLNIIQDNSNGLINDRAPHAPTVVLTDAFEFCRLELEYAMDKMADKAATIHLQTCGIQRRLGRKAQVTLTFTLSATLAQFVLSAGYMVTADGGIEFFTDTDVTVFNSSSFTVTATAKEVGSKYNVAAYSLNNLSQTRAFLASVTNTEPAQGGLDAETEAEAKARGFQAIRRKKGVLISADDFEQYAIEILGLGSVAKAVGLLTPDKLTKRAGFVHVFCLNPDGTPLNEAQRFALQEEMNAQVPAFLRDLEGEKIKTLASGVAVSSIELSGLEVNVIATLIAGDNPEARAQAINRALTNYLEPGRLPLGETVVLYSMISVVQNAGVRDVQSMNVNVSTFDQLTQNVTIETFYGNIPLMNEWTAAYCKGVTITLVNSANNESFAFMYGRLAGDLD